MLRTAPSIARVPACLTLQSKGHINSTSQSQKASAVIRCSDGPTYLEKRFLKIITSTHSSNNLLGFLLPDQLPLRLFTHNLQQESNRRPTLSALCKFTILNSMKHSKDRNACGSLAIIIRQSFYSPDDITYPTLTPSIVSHTSYLWIAKGKNSATTYIYLCLLAYIPTCDNKVIFRN